MSADRLFEIDSPDRKPLDALSPDARRTARQHNALAAGSHPLSLALGRPLQLHAEAAPVDDRTAPGRRCRDCLWKRTIGHHDRTYKKCGIDPNLQTHGAATDLKGWWPACTEHEAAS